MNYTIEIPVSWVPMLQALAEQDKLTPEQVIIRALGEELARYEDELHPREE